MRLIYLLLLFLIPTILAVPVVTVENTAITAPNIYYKEIPVGQESTIAIKIYNSDNIVYRFNIKYVGQLPVTVIGPTGTLATGISFTAPYVTINPGTTIYLYLRYNPTTEGTYLNTFTFNFEQQVVVNNTTTWSPVTSKTITLQLKAIKTTTTTTAEQTQTEQRVPEKCLIPLRSKIYKIVYLNETLTVSVGFINQCDNTTIELLDADIEGVPSDIAYITQTELKHQLEPGDVQYIKVTVDTTHLTKPQELLFDVILVGKKELSVETAKTTIDVKVISKSTEIPRKEEKQQIPTAKLLYVDYEIKNGYLVIKGVYYTVNETKIYLTDVPIYILTDEGQIVYYRPIPIEPGKSYCISVNLKGFVPFFECIQAPKKELCYQLTPNPTKVANMNYYRVGTSVTVEAFDCKTGIPVDVQIFLDNIRLNNNTFVVSEGTHTVRIVDGTEYKEAQFTFVGYKPVVINIMPIPSRPGNYTIKLEGTFAPSAKLTIYYNNNEVYNKIGALHKVTLDNEGIYKLVVETPVGKITKTIVIQNITTTPQSSNVPIQYIIYGIAGFALFTLIAWFIVKAKGMSLAEAATEIGKLVQ